MPRAAESTRPGLRLLVQFVVNARAGKPAQVVFRFRGCRKASLAGKFEVLTIAIVDVPLPRPHIGLTVSSKHADKGLIAVRLGDFISRSVLIGLHAATLGGARHNSNAFALYRGKFAPETIFFRKQTVHF
jgi:hypothetical protein